MLGGVSACAPPLRSQKPPMMDDQKSAFVTGGSGFIGGRLVRRLVSEGWTVRALARSPSAAEKVRSLGADPVSGDLERTAALRSGAEGCAYAFHAAAHLGEWGSRAEFERINVGGTRNVLDSCREAGVRRFVHVGTEAALLAGRPLVGAPLSRAWPSVVLPAARILVARTAFGSGSKAAPAAPKQVANGPAAR